MCPDPQEDSVTEEAVEEAEVQHQTRTLTGIILATIMWAVTMGSEADEEEQADAEER